jgi:predicted PurR-regulated permease PerM
LLWYHLPGRSDSPPAAGESLTIRDPWIRALVIVMLAIAAVYLASLLWTLAVQFADIILLFFLAWIISFVLEPLVSVLQYRARLGRGLAVLAAYLGCLVAISVAILKLAPRLAAQILQVANDLPLYVDWSTAEVTRLQTALAQQGMVISPESLLSYQEVLRHVESVGPLVLTNTVNVATGVANLLFQVLVVLVLSYYITLDGQRITAALLLALPPLYRDDARYLLVSVNRAFAGFIRGQLVQAAIYGLATAAVMTLAGLNLVLLTSLVAGLIMLIPFVGPPLSLAAPLVVAAVTRAESFWMVCLALFLLQGLVINVIAPRLMSHTVGLHPLLVFLAVLGGAKLAGVWGALFGVPILAVATAMVSFYRATVEDRHARLIQATADSGADDHLRPDEPLEAGPSGGLQADPAAAEHHQAPAPTYRPAVRKETSYS